MCRANIALARPTTAAVGHSRTRWQAAHARIPLYLCVCVVAFHRLKNAIVYVFESIIALLRRGGRAFSKSTTTATTTTSNHLAAPVGCTCMRFFFSFIAHIQRACNYSVWGGDHTRIGFESKGVCVCKWVYVIIMGASKDQHKFLGSINAIQR